MIKVAITMPRIPKASRNGDELERCSCSPGSTGGEVGLFARRPHRQGERRSSAARVARGGGGRPPARRRGKRYSSCSVAGAPPAREQRRSRPGTVQPPALPVIELATPTTVSTRGAGVPVPTRSFPPSGRPMGLLSRALRGRPRPGRSPSGRCWRTSLSTVPPALGSPDGEGQPAPSCSRRCREAGRRHLVERPGRGADLWQCRGAAASWAALTRVGLTGDGGARSAPCWAANAWANGVFESTTRRERENGHRGRNEHDDGDDDRLEAPAGRSPPRTARPIAPAQRATSEQRGGGRPRAGTGKAAVDKLDASRLAYRCRQLGIVRDEHEAVSPSACSSRRSAPIDSPLALSSAPVGSSARRRSGRLTSARAIATLWRSPPERRAG